jgi:hypothetical protein
MLAATTHILPATTIRRERLLPVPGRVIARKGQKVNPNDVVAEALLSPEHMLLEIARGLGVAPKEVERYLQRQEGDEVAEGDVIAGPVGIGRRVVRAPRAGTLVLVEEGHALIQLDSKLFELRAGVPGTVADLIPERGVVIETVAGLIQGVWGNENIDYGLLHLRLDTAETTLVASMLDVSFRGSVVAAGTCQDPKALQAAEELPLRGLILGSMDPALLPVARSVHYPIIILDGFGKLPMDSVCYKLLSTSERREVAMNAERWDRYAGTRPEVIIGLPTGSSPEILVETAAFAPGQQVRLYGMAHQTQVGMIVSIRHGGVTLPSGVRAPAAEVHLESGEDVLVPLANIEVLG